MNTRKLAAAVIALAIFAVVPAQSQQPPVDIATETDIEKLYQLYINRPSDFDPGAPDEQKRYETGLALRNRLEELGDETTDYFLSQLRETQRIAHASRIVTFFGQTGVAESRVLPEVRALLPQHYEDTTTTLLGAIVSYLMEHGTSEDVELLETLATHKDSALAFMARTAQKNLRTKLGIAQPPQNTPPSETPGPLAPTERPTPPPPTEKATPPGGTQDAEKPNTLLYVLLGLVVVAIVFVVLRKARAK